MITDEFEEITCTEQVLNGNKELFAQVKSSINVLRLMMIAEFTLTIFSCGRCHTEQTKSNHTARLFLAYRFI